MDLIFLLFIEKVHNTRIVTQFLYFVEFCPFLIHMKKKMSEAYLKKRKIYWFYLFYGWKIASMRSAEPEVYNSTLVISEL